MPEEVMWERLIRTVMLGAQDRYIYPPHAAHQMQRALMASSRPFTEKLPLLELIWDTYCIKRKPIVCECSITQKYRREMAERVQHTRELQAYHRRKRNEGICARQGHGSSASNGGATQVAGEGEYTAEVPKELNQDQTVFGFFE